MFIQLAPIDLQYHMSIGKFIKIMLHNVIDWVIPIYSSIIILRNLSGHQKKLGNIYFINIFIIKLCFQNM